MIDTRKIDEWIREVEQRPASAPEIVRLIANRLSELTRLNEQLRDENIQLRMGEKVEEYQRRIENLEFQLDLLKRQLSPEIPAEESKTNLILYNSQGQVLRVEIDFETSGSRNVVGHFQIPFDRDPSPPQLLLVEEKEEALFLFDSGRVSTFPVSQIPLHSLEALSWEVGFHKEPGIGEELAAILPSARMSLYEFCIQASRRGFVRKILESFFENHLSRGFIGSGVSLDSDRTCSLAFGDREDTFVMVSLEGMIFSMEVANIPLTVEEAIRLAPGDWVISLFTLREESSIIFIAQNGKVIHREAGWLEPVNTLKAKGQAIISKERRATGVRMIGSAPVEEGDWGVALLDNGQIQAFSMEEIFASGSLLTEDSSDEVLSFAIFKNQTSKKA